jgi:prepilin-type N-terminal cleavage/methylation domain-containing protein/prepilin-type processing-associated H-X9-DG protein
MRKRIAAFTLIELLVTVAIIAVLIAILLPALSKARAMAVTTKCLSNMRQIGIGFAQYRTEWNDFLPPVDANAAHVGGTLGVGLDPWRFTKDYQMWNSIGPYTGNQPTGNISGGRMNITKWYWGSIGDNPAKPLDFDEQILKGSTRGTIWDCPDPRDTWAGSPQYDYPMCNGYAESLYLVYPGGDKKVSTYISGNSSALVRPFNQIPNPSRSIQVGEITMAGLKAGSLTPKSLGTIDDVKTLDPSTPRTDEGFDLWRHNLGKGANLLFADGHANYYTAGDIVNNITYYPSDQYSMNNFQLP